MLFSLFESVFDELRTFVIQNCVPKMEVSNTSVSVRKALDFQCFKLRVDLFASQGSITFTTLPHRGVGKEICPSKWLV